ncbi:YraN family protein [Tumebacillus sp. ITR2]|uniref:UPF0102 protein JJB07_19990 n=1 Tax=Tumebacillus amylolyticus TaxID=2801339 RepID=A0ABS1JF84_9BACL|nr:YraN family protein [Tumebacillus amylolyticus]MBL0388880.1 YraN family protein [Tumebacillus amylolyticus]
MNNHETHGNNPKISAKKETATRAKQKPTSKQRVSTDPRKQLGDFGERVAADFLLHLGYRIIDRNWRRRGGELDIIAIDRDALVFVEVRTRSTRTFGTAEESVDWRKQRQVRKMASCYLHERPAEDTIYRDIRFDVITVYVDRNPFRVRDLYHLKHAF